MRTNKQVTEPIDEDAFKVFVRVRPFLSREKMNGLSKTNGNIISVIDEGNECTRLYVTDPDMVYDYVGRQERGYQFDTIFQDTSRNQDVFDQTVAPLLPNILEGYNATCFAYGMTGSGKTHTMLGDVYGASTGEKGLWLMTVEKLFQLMNEQKHKNYAIRISYLEIYNEQVLDLLDDKQSHLMIVEDPVRGVFVPELREIEVEHPNELIDLIVDGNNRRTMASTTANQFSSRSHAILQISVQTTGNSLDMADQIWYSKLSLIDLAGSERAASTSNRGQRMVEGANINKSLLSLGNCINILSDKNKIGSFVPYRDSKLTRLLKDSLGGNTKTCMIAWVSPSYYCYEESINTLKYAERARNIKKKTKKNIKEVEIHMHKYKEIIDSLKGEIDTLKTQLKVEQSNKNDRDKRQKKKIFNAHILESKTERDEVLDMLQGHEEVKHTMHVSQVVDKVNCISDMSIIEEDYPLSQDDRGDINADLEAVKRERDELEHKLNNNDISVWYAETSYFDKIRNQLYANFEEEWDITHSVAEINELQKENNERILFLANQMEELIEQKEEALDEKDKQMIGEQLNDKLSEIENLEKAMQDNANILKEWLDAKAVNEENRNRIQSMFTNIQSSKKKDIIELQIVMRKLKLEKADLHLQNLEIKKEVMVSKRQNDSKDKKLRILQYEIEKMKKDLFDKDKELERSKEILLQKDEELKRIKKVACLSPKDVNRMANDKNNIEVLQQIAVNNNLSPSIYSNTSMNSKDSKTILNHPFYQKLKNKQQESNTCGHEDKENAIVQSKKYMPQTVLGMRNGSEPQIMREAMNRFGAIQGGRRNIEQESFQTISSVSINNEVSAATDMHMDEFFEHRQDAAKGS